jgi:hypothetical protein
MTAIRYNELVGDKDNLEREKGYVAEAKKNIDLLSGKLTDENSETTGSFSSKISKGFQGIVENVKNNKWEIIRVAAAVGSVGLLAYATATTIPIGIFKTTPKPTIFSIAKYIWDTWVSEKEKKMLKNHVFLKVATKLKNEITKIITYYKRKQTIRKQTIQLKLHTDIPLNLYKIMS